MAVITTGTMIPGITTCIGTDVMNAIRDTILATVITTAGTDGVIETETAITTIVTPGAGTSTTTTDNLIKRTIEF